MGNQQSKWKGRLANPFRHPKYVHLDSTSSSQPLLAADGYPETNYLLLAHGSCTEDHRADIEALRKRNLDLEKRVDELTQKVNKLLSRPLEPQKVNKNDTQTVHERNSILQGEINRLKAKIIALENASANAFHKGIHPDDKTAAKKKDPKQLKSQHEALKSAAVSDSGEIELDTEPSEELVAVLIVLIFLIAILIGMHL